MKNADEPAYPGPSDLHGRPHTGLTKREHLAALMLSEIVRVGPTGNRNTTAVAVCDAVRFADLLLIELDKPSAVE